MKQIGANAISDSSITSTKPAESFMKRVTLQDNAAGNTLGWNPDGVQTNFGIEEDRHFGGDSTMVSIIVESLPLGSTNHLCDPVNVS